MKFKIKDEFINAIQFTGTNQTEVLNFMIGGLSTHGNIPQLNPFVVEFYNWTGKVRAFAGDYILRTKTENENETYDHFMKLGCEEFNLFFTAHDL